MAEFKAIETQEELDRIIGERLKRERDATEKKYADFETLKEKAARYDEIEKKDFAGQIKTLTEKLSAKDAELASSNSTISELTARANKAETSMLKAKIAHENGVPLELAGRLVGETEEDIRKDAETFASFFTKSAPPLRSADPVTATNKTDAALLNVLAQLNNSN